MEGFHKKVLQSVKLDWKGLGQPLPQEPQGKGTSGVTAKRRELPIFVNRWEWMGSPHLGWNHLPRSFQTQGVGIGLQQLRACCQSRHIPLGITLGSTWLLSGPEAQTPVEKPARTQMGKNRPALSLKSALAGFSQICWII